MKTQPSPLSVSKSTIDHYRQNKPHYIADDMEQLFGVPKDATYKILLSRGVFKWLSVRRDLIKLKDEWKREITDVLEALHACKGNMSLQHRTWFLRGFLDARQKDRKALRALCHSSRFQAPDNDPEARRWLDARHDSSCDTRGDQY